MDTAATIPTGAMAERWSFSAFVIFSLVVSTITYPIYANWVWGGGWLSQLGAQFGLGQFAALLGPDNDEEHTPSPLHYE
jgi:Amt family ammonium transporter